MKDTTWYLTVTNKSNIQSPWKIYVPQKPNPVLRLPETGRGGLHHELQGVYLELRVRQICGKIALTKLLHTKQNYV